jgi:hypothetical protein
MVTPDPPEPGAAARENLRAALDRLDLEPEQTQDDISPPESQDQRLREDVPPHYGS